MKTYTVQITLSLDAETKEEALTRYIESINDRLWNSDSVEVEEEVAKEYKKDIARCEKCGLNPNDTQPKEQQKWETEYIEEHGLCSACDNE